MNRLNWLNWKRVLILLMLLVLLVGALYAFFFYRHIQDARTDYFEETEAFVKEETSITAVDEIFHFQEAESYYIVYGKDDKGKKWVLFNPGKNKDPEKTMRFPEADMLSEKEIEKEWQADCASCTLKNAVPAMIKEEPLWELTYMDEKNRYILEYRSMEDGSTFEKLTLQRKYNKKG